MSIGRNTGYNLIGSLVPTLLALVTVPLYLELVGLERYGVLAIAWVLLGYFGLFDLGLSRATAQRIAALRSETPELRARTLWSAITINAGMGAIGAAVLWIAAAWYFRSSFDVSQDLKTEVIDAVPLLALSVPVATTTGVLMGALQGRELFRETNIISVASTSLFQLLPLGVAWLNGPELYWLLVAGLCARVIALIPLWRLCRAHIVGGEKWRFERAQAVALVKYGGWVTVAATFGPLLVFSDRFFIGTLLGAAAVAIYTVPFQLAQRMSIIPIALANALFPRIAASKAPEEQRDLAVKASKTLAGAVTLPTIVGVFLMDPFLEFWVGAEIQAQASLVGKILLIGYWANALAVIPYVRLQASGRPDVVTKILLAEIIPYLVLLYFGLQMYGLVGAAAVMLVRFAADYALLSYAAQRDFPGLRLISFDFVLLVLSCVVTELALPSPLFAVGAFLLIAALAAASGWMNAPQDAKSFVFRAVGRMRSAIFRAEHRM